MGIALEYAFLVAVTGGLAAICLAYFLESIEDEQMRDRREAPHGLRAPDQLAVRAVSGTIRPPDKLVPSASRQPNSCFSLTPK